VKGGHARGAVFVFAFVLGALACRRPDPVRELLDSLEQAAEDRDADALRARLSDDFQGPEGSGRTEAYGMARRYLAAYESVRLEIYDVTVTRGESGADVHLRADFTGTARRLPGLASVLPPSASYVFDLHVVPVGSAWKVARAQWEEARPASP
jgi:SnoaL-like protein